ncbi:MAG: ribonuclease D [Candidatus Nanopelagicales bacterium]
MVVSAGPVLGNEASGDGPGGEPPQAPPLPLLELRDGLPSLTQTQADLDLATASIAAGSGPIALDTERASGYRYGQRAYLIQMRREGAGTILVDPIAMTDFSGLARALHEPESQGPESHGPEWILHSATQDLPCLAELGLRPPLLFDTELAARLLGMQRHGLAPLVEQILGRGLAKVHGAADWSRRPLPADWLEYAALDVEVLIELRAHLREQLQRSGKWDWAQQEFAALRDAPPPAPRSDPWRRTSGIHRVRSRRGLAIVEQLWRARDDVARATDLAPGRLLPDSAIVAAAQALPPDLPAMRAVPGFHGRGVARYANEWGDALRHAWAIPDAGLPPAAARGAGPPPARSWLQRDPAAAARLARARAELSTRAEELSLPTENLLSPDVLRRLMWQPPAGDHEAIRDHLRHLGARPWQVGLTAEILGRAITATAG